MILKYMRQFLLGSAKNIFRDSYIWNTIGGALDAGQSALLLIVISRTNPVEDAGVFSIAYAIACLAVTVGKWGMRNFQATDVGEKYHYGIYVSSRIVTCILMMLLPLFYSIKGIFVSDYTLQKCMVIFLMCLLKLLDAAEDVVHGMFQKKGRLDVAAKCMATRYMLVLFTCMTFLYLTHNLLISLGISVVVSVSYFILTTLMVYDEFREKICISFWDKNLWRLLADCFSLFAGSFLMIYIANVSKYAIDEYMDETVQACFNYIFMPVYVISVLNMFVYQPVLTKLAVYYREDNRTQFLKLFSRQLLLILCLILVVLATGAVLGIPFLSILYNIDLKEYKVPFLILLIGGGLLAVSSFLNVVVTIMRKQNWLIIGYISTAAMAFLAARPLVRYQGVMGAAALYTGIVLLQAIMFAFVFVRCYVPRIDLHISD